MKLPQGPTILALDPEVPTELYKTFPEFAATDDLYYSTVRCPRGSFINSIQVFRDLGGMRSFMLGIKYTCSSLIDGSVVVRKTDGQIPDQIDWDPYAPSEPLDGSITKCDKGTYVAAIQGFKYIWQAHIDYTSPLSALGYRCETPKNGRANVKRTDAGITDNFAIRDKDSRHFTGTHRPHCPKGQLVTALQAYRHTANTDSHPSDAWLLAELRFLCEPAVP